MLSGLEREPALVPPAADLDVVLGGPSDRNARMRQIRQLQQRIIERAVSVPDFDVERLDTVAQLAHAGHLVLGRLALPPRAADRLGGAIPLRLEFLDGRDQAPARNVRLEDRAQRDFASTP